ncbi:OmpA family protein [Aureibaculum conchae]|uniref:OmpA family protein n=1 Tax=Aureibaculum sp. 2308TA14-22 TaxID=3108392 RepID=UPI00339B5192
MRKFLVLTIVWCFSMSVFSQTAESKYLIKYLETNTAQPDYGVTFLSDNQFIYKSPNTEKISTNSNKLSESNLFLATVGSEGDIIDKKQIQGLPTDKITKTGAAYSPNLKTVYFSAKKYRKSPRKKDKEQLYSADVDENGGWINVVKLPFSDDRYSFGEPSLSATGKELYFTSDMPSTLGGADIFMVAINADGSFGKPVNLGNRINTSGNEVTPYITKDLKLYFSSDNHKGGLGNLDVYCIDLKNPTATPNHLDAPINSVNDDFAFIINKSDDRGYFSSNRLQGQNNHDIYSFLVEKVKEDGPCVQEITGVVKDNGTKEIIKDAIITLFDEENKELEQIKTDVDGKYALTLDCNKTYTLKAGAENYNTEDHIVNTANYLEAPTLEANKFLIKKSEEEIENDKLITENEGIKEGIENVSENEVTVEETSGANLNDEEKEEKKAVAESIDNTSTIKEDEAAIKPVYFGFDRSSITTKSARELDKLAKILKNNKNIHVELSSYTDSRGSSAYNLKLSERRAQASADYLVSQGIDRSRIKARGYGESKMVNKCIDGIECSEAAHEKNRRTEFAFVNPQASIVRPRNNPSNKLTEITKVKEKPVKEVVKSASYSETIEPKSTIDKGVEKTESKQAEIVAVNETQDENLANNADVTLTKTDNSNTPSEEKSSNVDETKREVAVVTESIKRATDKSNQKATIEVDLNESNKEEETLSDEAKWLNKELEKSNEEYNKAQNEKTEKVKPQLIEPMTETKQKAEAQKEKINKEYDNLVAKAEAEEKVTEKFNFEKQKEETNKKNNNTDPNQLLADIKAKGATDQTGSSDQLEKKPADKNKNKPTVKKEAVLNASQVSVKAMQSKRGKYIETNNPKKIHALRVIFRIQPNMNAVKGYKDAYVVIKSPTGKVVNEKGVFPLADGKNQAYTDETTLYYNKQSIKAVMFIDKIVHKFSKGTYTVNIFIDGVAVGENILTLS